MMTEADSAPKPILKTFVIKNKLGLHARPAALFVQTANRFECEIQVEKDDQMVNGKSIMGIMTLAAGVGSEIRVSLTGTDAAQALESLTQLIESNFGENDL